MGIPVKLDAFEGPLDLLLHLIEKNKVNIYDIPIVEITGQYMEYIREMQRQDLDVMSEFLVMAATLLDIKSRMLLPKEEPQEEDPQEEDPRQELVEKLLEYKMYKYMSYELKDRQEDASLAMYRGPELPEQVKSYRQPVNLSELLDGITLAKLYRIYKDLIRRQENRIDPIRSKFGTLEKEEVDMDATWKHVEEYIHQHKTCSFRELCGKHRTKMYTIISFLVILELMKIGEIAISQEEIFGEIRIQAREPEEAVTEK